MANRVHLRFQDGHTTNGSDYWLAYSVKDLDRTVEFIEVVPRERPDLGYSGVAGGGSPLLTAPWRPPGEPTDGSPGWKEAASAQAKTTAEPNIKFQNTVGVTQSHSTTAPWRPSSRTCVSRIDNDSRSKILDCFSRKLWAPPSSTLGFSLASGLCLGKILM
ncbi:hypothetical protein M441DRAFT_450763 [Trichoderma asperellum CBS 433.97]|uniref:Uncharacterized protein n=1 Tax=Trichoderma asperellum (strain ATCC 204424 / CBS 433.97 / NBRC 101777) TaxID=1042311 RepID=A0A2T3ZJ76_TRIA4|nr:hypothetical protein M441DRAFT_450763 [Trichoderma asperellum CBS 433.97]PTB44846.1 hypothetical protein M441DRAFT_450763 [Trichoderma asperellum CBS 433.97]